MISGYDNPLRSIPNIAADRVDQGVDFSGAGPIYAIGAGVVKTVFPNGAPGWPGTGYVQYQLTAGPAAGKYVYVAEYVMTKVAVGQTVNTSTEVCTLTGGCEMGWAAGPSYAPDTAHRICGTVAGQPLWADVDGTHQWYTAMGDNFAKLLAAVGFSKPFIYAPNVLGHLCPDFPATWAPSTESPKENLMSLTVLDTKHASVPVGRTRFIKLKVQSGQFQLVSFNGAKISGYALPHTQHSNGAVLGVEAEPDGVHFVVTADDGGTFRYAFSA